MPTTALNACCEPAPESAVITRLFEEHASFVRSLARQLLGSCPDADDVTQEVFFIAWRKLGGFRDVGLRTWLASATVKVAAATRRRAWLRRQLGFEGACEEPVERTNPEHALGTREARAIFDAVAAKLSDKKRTVLVLADLHDFTGPEIAEALGCPLQTVYTRLFHARRDFQAHLAASGLAVDPDEAGDPT